MLIEAREQKKLNSIFLFLKKQDREYFETHDISQCEECEGTGLHNYIYLNEGGASWMPNNFCPSCKGVGYIGLLGDGHIDEIYVEDVMVTVVLNAKRLV